MRIVPDKDRPRKSVQRAFDEALPEMPSWLGPELLKVGRLVEAGNESEALRQYGLVRLRLQEEAPEWWDQIGLAGTLRLLSELLGHEDGGRQRIAKLYPDVDATPYETTDENLERVRSAMRPGQLWVHVRGPGIGKLQGYLECRLQELALQGADVSIKPKGRKAIPEFDIEAARLKDEKHLTYVEIGRRFDWPLQRNAYGKDSRCRTAEAAVKRGRKLRRT